jgi:hypothetical protein
MDRVLFLGDFSENSTNVSQKRELEKLCDLMAVDFRRNPREATAATKGTWDLIIYSKCNELTIDAFLGPSKKLMWFMDPLGPNFDENVARAAQCDVIVCALTRPYQRHLEIWDSESPKSIHFLEEGFDEEVDKYYREINWKRDIGFIGSLHSKSRANYHNALSFDVITASRLNHNKEVGATKINLNFTHGGCSDRVYKVMAAGGFLLSEPWDHCPFIPGKEIALFSGVYSLHKQIRYYLRNNEERERIAITGHHAVQKYTRQRWAEKILHGS